MSIIIIIYIFFVLLMIIGAGFFAGSETAGISINKARLHSLVEMGDKKAIIISDLLRDKRQFIGMALVGTNICIIIGTLIAEKIINYIMHHDFFSSITSDVRIFVSPEVSVITTLVMTPIFLVTSDIIPKVIFRYNANTILIAIAKPIQFLYSFLSPLVNFFTMLSDSIIKLSGHTGSSKASFISKKEFKLMVEEGEKWGAIDTVERRMIYGILDLSRTIAQEVMIPIIDVQLLKISDLTIENIKKIAKEAGFSRFPVYEDRVDDIKGYIDIYEILSLKKSDEVDLKKYIRKPLSVPETKRLDDLLRNFLILKQSVAVVVDEYGSCVGWVTREDIIEEIVGEIKDEFERLEHHFSKVEDNVYVVSGSVSLAHFNQRFGSNIPMGMYKTLAGFLLSKFGRVPNEGEKFTFDKFLFEISEIKGHKISKIKLTVLKK